MTSSSAISISVTTADELSLEECSNTRSNSSSSTDNEGAAEYADDDDPLLMPMDSIHPPPPSWFEPSSSLTSSAAATAANATTTTTTTLQTKKNLASSSLSLEMEREELWHNHEQPAGDAIVTAAAASATAFAASDDVDAENEPYPHHRTLLRPGNPSARSKSTLSSLSSSSTHVIKSSSSSSPLPQKIATTVLAAPRGAPSWRQVSSQVLPEAARELLSSSLRRVWHTARISYYVGTKWHFRHSDMGNNSSGYFRNKSSSSSYSTTSTTAAGTKNSALSSVRMVTPSSVNVDPRDDDLPPFSSLNWVDRQLVQEWRTVGYCWGDNDHENDDGRDYDDDNDKDDNHKNNNANKQEEERQQQQKDQDEHHEEDDEDDFCRARTLVPQPHARPLWRKADNCHDCHRPFGPTLLRHHCRLCGQSFCHVHSSYSHKLPHLGYDPDVPERVCDGCKRRLVEHNLAERVAWRLARCRDYLNSDLTPYFETGLDTYEDVALRITQAALTMARNIPLGAQAHVAVETVEVLRKHGLKGIYGLILRKEFLAAADLLCKVLGINKTAWPLSVHELSAAIFYALAQHRAMRGMNPEGEHLIHTFRNDASMRDDRDQTGGLEGSARRDSLWTQESPARAKRLSRIHEEENADECGVRNDSAKEVESAAESNSKLETPLLKYESTVSDNSAVIDDTDTYNPMEHKVPDLLAMESETVRSQKTSQVDDELPFSPVCDPVPGPVLSSLLFYAPIALNFIYAEREVDMQLLAAQQGWRLLYAHLQQDCHSEGFFSDRPASALFLHKEQKIACLAIRGTATVNDVVTDIRQVPVPFPETETDVATAGGIARFDDDWTPVFRGQGLAACGMARAAVNLYREHIDALVLLSEEGYRIRITGHSLGASVATLLGALVLRHFEQSVMNRDTATSPQSLPASSPPQHSDLLRVYGYGSPSCVDAELSDYVRSFVTTVVLHDDVVPRLTPTSIRGLLKHLLHIRETWVKMHLADDLRAISDRARTAWAPRWRGSFTIGDSSSVKRYCRKQIQYGKKKLMSVKGSVVKKAVEEEELEGSEELTVDPRDAQSTAGVGDDEADVSDKSFSLQAGDIDASTSIAALKEGHFADAPSKASATYETSSDLTAGDASHIAKSDDTSKDEASENMDTNAVHIVDFIGGIDKHNQGVILDGDEFFDPHDTLMEGDDESSTDDSLCVLGPIEVPSEKGELADEESLVPDEESGTDGVEETTCADGTAAEEDSWVPYDEHEEAAISRSDIGSFDSDTKSLEEEGGPSAVMLEETPLPRMFLPGKIVHIYTHRGGYKAAFVPRAFRELRRISLAGNMLSDHTTQAYYEALLEVQSVRQAPEGLPKWTAFDEDDTCSCCASRFTWASTSDSEAQEARDKHNCRSCGTLVCDPCAKRRMPLPSIGITVAVRVCDRCYNDQSGALTGRAGSSLASSFVEGADAVAVNEQHQENSVDDAKEQPERQRDRRSLVVDELASRIHSTVSCT